jgi:(E)-4-hydroxy-3-methylbut-2-enyl-diphosphate synthase
MGSLLWAGIGDTIRVSLSGRAGRGDQGRLRDPEIARPAPRAASTSSRARSCARQGFDVIRTVERWSSASPHIQEPISLSIIGCVVNGPGEAADDRSRLHRRRQGKPA